jgi:hypothetical protein
MALEVCRQIECLGGCQRHSCLSFHPDDVEGRDIFEHLNGSFGSVVDVPYRETLKGWPDGPNQCFYEAARWIEMLPSKEPWFWMEADCIPTRPRWLDDIESEYHYSGKPVLGVLNQTFSADGKVSGEHVTGVAVYPHDLLAQCASLRSIVRATSEYRKAGHCPPAFDCYIAPWAVPNCAQSQTIRHYWKSFDFSEGLDGEIYCKFKKHYGASNRVDLSAAVIHGAKDFSLLNILQSRLINTIKTLPA